ncbi:ABC transporter ATP-binding protein [Lutibaculum baratangense]|uniref:Putative ferric iron transport ATP-binding protein n=1 Tax=Lutibaculum baratangense AMV1 TaxID=631454 RepID=V4RB80_9HYPH|nr:ABC transporter ATP-binding protein [Lutibaculum baratangense]ESR23391.1 putative ferric iron transport ATP-binding protein [Lutibaculum baratangense AMV1]
MARVRFEAVTKRFGRTNAVDAVSLDIRRGEFLALLGPSGCGKTTLLRLIAGFETPDAGTISFDDTIVGQASRSVAPEDRGLAMVFQSYALWPHMSVAENVGFSLSVRRVARPERERRVSEALAAVGLQDFASRRPHELSGGQRQRVALARCLAMRPGIVLLDEPLANLDTHLRETMQREFRRFHGESGATFVYVTHDQTEAMSMADRVAVMDRGQLQQVGHPRDLYREPSTEMVARFVGRGMVVPVEVERSHDGFCEVRLDGLLVCVLGAAKEPGPGLACLRPENLEIAAPGDDVLCGPVVDTSYQGAATIVTVLVAGVGELRVQHTGTPPRLGEQAGVRVLDAWLLPS